MIDLSHLLAGGGLCAAALYLLRLNDLRAGQHLPRCIGVQRGGLLVSAWVMGSGPGGAQWLQLLDVALLLALLAHLIVTGPAWTSGAPREAETMPGDLDDLVSTPSATRPPRILP